MVSEGLSNKLGKEKAKVTIKIDEEPINDNWLRELRKIKAKEVKTAEQNTGASYEKLLGELESELNLEQLAAAALPFLLEEDIEYAKYVAAGFISDAQRAWYWSNLADGYIDKEGNLTEKGIEGNAKAWEYSVGKTVRYGINDSSHAQKYITKFTVDDKSDQLGKIHVSQKEIKDWHFKETKKLDTLLKKSEDRIAKAKKDGRVISATEMSKSMTEEKHTALTKAHNDLYRDVLLREPVNLNPTTELSVDYLHKITAKYHQGGKGEGKEIIFEDEKEVEAILSHGKYVLISAGLNPKNSSDMKQKAEFFELRHHELKAKLIEDGYKFTQVVGKYGDLEDSFLVMAHDMKPDDAVTYGKAFNQDSVIHVDAGKAQQIYPFDSKTDDGQLIQAGQRYEAKTWEAKASEDSNYYTELWIGEKKVGRFSLKLDFNNLKNPDGTPANNPVIPKVPEKAEPRRPKTAFSEFATKAQSFDT